MIDENSLLEKWWWRALKAIYILVWIASFSIVALIAYYERPQAIKSDRDVIVNCDGGKSYRQKLSVYFFGSNPTFTNGETNYFKNLCASEKVSTSGGKSMDYLKVIKAVGTDKDLNDYLKKNPEVKLYNAPLVNAPITATTNFKYDFAYDHNGSWKSVLIFLTIGFLVVFVVIEAAKSIFLYILGISVWRGMSLYGLLFIASMFSKDKKESNKTKDESLKRRSQINYEKEHPYAPRTRFGLTFTRMKRDPKTGKPIDPETGEFLE